MSNSAACIACQQEGFSQAEFEALDNTQAEGRGRDPRGVKHPSRAAGYKALLPWNAEHETLRALYEMLITLLQPHCLVSSMILTNHHK